MICASCLRIEDARSDILFLQTKHKTYLHITIVMPNHSPELNFLKKKKTLINETLKC